MLHIQHIFNHKQKGFDVHTSASLICHPDEVHVFISEALSLLGEVAHHREESFQVKVEEGLRICVQKWLQAFVESRVGLGHVVVQGNQSVLHCVPYGFQGQVVVVQVSAGLLCCFTVPGFARGNVPQHAGEQNRLLHVADGRAVSPQGQVEAVSGERGLDGLHGASWTSGVGRTVPVLW